VAGGGSLKIGFLGGLPPALGGGGLDDQMRLTAAALTARGDKVVSLSSAEAFEPVDVIHAFGASPNTWYALTYRTRNLVPVVLSPVLLNWRTPGERVLAGGLARLKIGYRNTLNMARELVTTADHLVALTEHESTQLRRLGVPAGAISVVPNGTDAAAPLPADGEQDFVLLVGGVQPRKRQAEILEALPDHDVVIAGAFLGTSAERTAWDALLTRRPRARWLGHVADRQELLGLYASTRAVVLMSVQEGQSLAVLDALAMGVPVVASDLPSHRELAARWPERITVVGGTDELSSALATLPPRPAGRAPGLASWGDVAGRLQDIYARVLASQTTHGRAEPGTTSR
jgi:glycosyltransferase involved in cell wall biosynthesis